MVVTTDDPNMYKRSFVYSVIVTAIAMATPAETPAAGKDKPPQVRYHNVSFNELIAAYRRIRQPASNSWG